MTNGRKNVEIESQAVGKAPHQGVQPSGLVPAAFKTTTTTTSSNPTTESNLTFGFIRHIQGYWGILG